MGKLFEMKTKVEQLIVSKKLDPIDIRGKISLRAGVMLATISASTPDDNVKIEKLKTAVLAVLNERI